MVKDWLQAARKFVRAVAWGLPVKPSPAEQALIKAVQRPKLFVFLREHPHELFDEEFQAGLAETYVDRPKGQPPVPPAMRSGLPVRRGLAGYRSAAEPDGEAVVGVPERDVDVELVHGPEPKPKSPVRDVAWRGD
jgi:hypothetical protein